MHKRVSVLNVKVTVRVQILQNCLFALCLLNNRISATEFGDVVHHQPDCCLKLFKMFFSIKVTLRVEFILCLSALHLLNHLFFTTQP